MAVMGLAAVYFSPIEELMLLAGIKTVNGCPLYTFAGIACPFCGMGRSFSCLTDFYIARSFYYNPMGLIFYFLTGLISLLIFIMAIKKRKLVLKEPAKRLWYLSILFFAVMWVLNILFGHHTH